MLFPFLTLPDGTVVVYSEIKRQNGKDHVLVKFERWNDVRDDFDSMECMLPDGKMEKVIGFSKEEAEDQHTKMIALQDMILECSQEDTEKELCQS